MGLYERLGVDAQKRGVEEAFSRLLRSAVPGAFANIVRCPQRGDGLVLHVDGAGSKPVIAYLCYKEEGGGECFDGLMQDVVAMNVDDVIAVGARPLLFADYVAVNTHRIDKQLLLRALARGLDRALSLLSTHGVPLELAGGETADLPDQLRTLDLVGVVLGEINLERAVRGNVREGDVLVGLRSGGRAKYEERENSGIMCNGLTLARHVLLSKKYSERYPETREEKAAELTYRGRYELDDYIDELGSTVGEALLSPTRIFAPIIGEVLVRAAESVRGIVHVTGGGLTKLTRLGRGVRYVVDSPPRPDPIFELIRREGRIDLREMYEVFNMGIGIVVIAEKGAEEEIISASEKYDVEAAVIGRVVEGEPGVNELVVYAEGSRLHYSRTVG
ncbi:MAG: AIR synthase-related protein [Fervidicoccaceae archaeon]